LSISFSYVKINCVNFSSFFSSLLKKFVKVNKDLVGLLFYLNFLSKGLFLVEEHTSFMREALAEAEKAFALGEVPIGAVVVYKGEIIGSGHNLREKLADASAHAELIALRKAAKNLADWRLTNCTLYATIEPCPMCAGGLVQFRIQRLVYGAKDPKAGAICSILEILQNERFNHRVEVVAGVLAEDCRAVMQRFFQKIRNK